jgi:type II secretory pathway predicted ATPase ExeA
VPTSAVSLKELLVLIEVMEHYGLAREFQNIGLHTYYETPQHRQLIKEIKAALSFGKLVALSDMIGTGKTMTFRKIRDELTQQGELLVSQSLSVDRERVTLPTLMLALHRDLATEKEPKLPAQAEKREGVLRDLIRKRRKPIALFIDDAHSLSGKTLNGIKLLIEMVQDSNGTLSVMLAGKPKLKNDLMRPTMEEIGGRASVFSMDGVLGDKQDYLQWLITRCLKSGTKPTSIIDADALDQLAERLMTPLQFESYLTRALEQAYQVGGKPITSAVIDTVLSKEIDDLEPKLTRQGYHVRSLSELLNVRPSEIKAFLRGQVDASRAQDLQAQMLRAGIPL